MNTQSVIIGLIFFILLLYFIWRKIVSQKPQADTDASRPSASLLPIQEISNDRLIIVKDASFTALEGILTSLCNMYNKEQYQVQPRLTKITEREFAIVFPFDIEFEFFCYFINYIKYPMGLDNTFSVTGWTTTKTGDAWITEKSANKKAMLFIPPDDKSYDNVFMTTIDNIGYKLDFSIAKGGQLLHEPKIKFNSPSIGILELANKEYRDFS